MQMQMRHENVRVKVNGTGNVSSIEGWCVQVQTLLLTPICPHTCDHVWRDKLQQPSTVLTAGWPKAPQPKAALQVLSFASFVLSHACPSNLAFIACFLTEAALQNLSCLPCSMLPFVPVNFAY